MNGLPRTMLLGVLLLALVTGTSSGPAVGQPAADKPPADKPTAEKPAAANVQVLPATLPAAQVGDGAIRIPLVAVNQGTERARIWFRPVLFDARGQSIALDVTGLWRDSSADWLQAGEIVPFTLTLRASGKTFDPWRDARLPLKGHIAIVSTSERGPVIKSLKIDMRELTVPQIQPAALEVSGVIGTGVLSIAVLLLALLFRKDPAPKGSASWSADSIGANVALGSGLVTALVGLAGLPQLTAYASRPTYGLLIAIFAAVVALGSPAANLLGKAGAAALSFFAAASLVLWGAIGQLLVAFFLVLELRRAAVLAESTTWTLLTLDVALGLGVISYVLYVVARPQTRTLEGGASQKRIKSADGESAQQEWAIP